MVVLMTQRIKGLTRRALRHTVDIVLATLLVVQMFSHFWVLCSCG